MYRDGEDPDLVLFDQVLWDIAGAIGDDLDLVLGHGERILTRLRFKKL
jgi:hypothetical protein